MNQVVVKRAGHDEAFDIKKVYASVYASMLAARETTKMAENVAGKVSEEIAKWAQTYHEITSADIRSEAAKKLQELNVKAHFLYLHHKLMF